MSRRPLPPEEVRIQRALDAMAPGGRIRSESPVVRHTGQLMTQRQGGGGVPAPVLSILRSSEGYNSATPPYKAWISEWNNNIPVDTVAPLAYMTATMQAVGDTRTSFEATVLGVRPSGDKWVVTFSGGPFTVGQEVTSSVFAVDMDGLWDSADLTINYSYSLASVPSEWAPGFEVTGATLWLP